MNITDTLQYSGFVKIKRLIAGKVVEETSVKNNGTSLLFKTLCGVLCGQDRHSDMPLYLEFGYDSSSNLSDNYTPGLVTRISLVNRVVENFNVTSTVTVDCGALFTAYIPGSMIVYLDEGVNWLFLCSGASLNDNTTHLAEVKLDTPLEFQNNSNFSYIIEWLMTVDNVSTADGGIN